MEGNKPPDINGDALNSMDTDNVNNDDNVNNVTIVDDNASDDSELQHKLMERQQVLSSLQMKSIDGFHFSNTIPKNFNFFAQTNSGSVPNPREMNNLRDDNAKKQNVTPTISGADIYTTVLNKKTGQSKKRRRSPLAKQPAKELKKSNNTITTKNRFSIFNTQNKDKPKNEEVKTCEKPTPFYVRGEKNTSEIRKWMNELKISDYDIKILFQGHEAKLQVKTIDEYRKIQSFFEQKNIPNYTYQLKSARSIRAVIKGLDPRIESDEITNALSDLEFIPRNVFKTNNRNGDKSNVVLVELEPCKDNTKSHPIFELKRLLNMVITVEVPKKNNQPKQCYNCQEYGHTKNRCFLAPICAICAEKHTTNQCDKDKNDKSAKVCNNCGENHTANWKGCQVYQVLLERLNPKQRREQRIANNQQKRIIHTTKQNPEQNLIKGISYANVVAGNANKNNKNSDESFNSNDIIKLMFMMQANMQALQSNISEIINKQNALENSIVEINKMLCKICKQK